MPEANADNWQHWLNRHQAALFLLARQHLATTQEAEDAVQEGFVKFWRTRHEAKDPAAYLFACVRSAAIDLRRSRNARRVRESQSAAPSSPIFQSGNELEETRRHVEDALRHLPAEQREVVVMKIWSELTFAQIAAALQIPQNTAASRYRYAISRLQSILQPEVRRD